MTDNESTYAVLTDQELITEWNNEDNMEKRDQLIEVLMRRDLFPSVFTQEWESSTGAYPDISDPEFLNKLLRRREFADSYQSSWKPQFDPCAATDEFNISAVQRFAANFMSPKTPYMSALLYHGTGVGKTCSAVQIAEQWLNFYPQKKVIILAPPTIQEGFINNIFDITKVRIGTEEDEPNVAVQCTGNYYMEATGAMFERNPKRIENKALNLIRRRYEIFGYTQFANTIATLFKDNIPERIQGEERLQRERKLINDKYSGRLLIIDEVHNLRDLPTEKSDKDEDKPGGEEEEQDEKAGKILTPLLRKVLDYATEMKLVTMTATPMYNNHKEIVFVLNLLLQNEKRPQLRVNDIFKYNTNDFTRNGRQLLGQLAGAYVSYMRGENPESFPLRLDPKGIDSLASYPSNGPAGGPVGRHDFIEHLPIVPVEFTGDSLEAQRMLLDQLPEGATGIAPPQMAPIIQAATCIMPPVGDASLAARSEGKTALSLVFHKQVVGGELTFKAKTAGGAAWLGLPTIAEYAPKIAAVLERIATAEGVCFIYSRFVQMGAVPLALALEANGYTPYGRSLGYLSDGMQVAGGRRCAYCDKREGGHEGQDHEFVPAKYVLLTGDAIITPKKKAHIKVARSVENREGGVIKVIVGSSVASEGVDLRFIREIHILEGWYHLNKTEQIVGRGIRTCSHALLPKEKRNCTVYLYCGVLPADDERESGDLYSYRVAYSKGRIMGAVSRILKENALDCNLNRKAINIETEEKARVLDSQRNPIYTVNLSDKPFTAICDWMESCDYKCKPDINIEELRRKGQITEVSYDEYTSRWYDSRLKGQLRARFAEQPSYRKEELIKSFSGYPAIARASLFNFVIGNPAFVVNHKGRDGYIIERNEYYLFQPFKYSDIRIPMAIRAARIPVRQDSYSPEFMEAMRAQMGPTAAATEEEGAAAEEEGAAEEEVTETNIQRITESWKEWVIALTADDAEVPEDIITWTIGDSKEKVRREESRRMLAWFAAALRTGGLNEVRRMQLIQVLMEYFFDEELNQAERMQFYTDDTLRAEGALVAPEQFLREGRRSIYVYIDQETGEDKYMCEGRPCEASIRAHFKGLDPEDSEADKKARNPAYGLAVNEQTTGPTYGFMVPKYGEAFIFKTGVPPPVGKKVTKGQECANVSQAKDHRKRLVGLGAILLKAIGTNFGLTEVNLTEGPNHPINYTQICTLTDLFLRLMDIMRLNGLRWFYRPVASIVTGHQPTLRKKASALKV